MIKLEIRVKIIPHKKNEFMQAVKNIGNSDSLPATIHSLTIFQNLNDDNLFYCQGEWDSRQALDDYQKSIQYEMLIGAIQVLGEIQQAHIHDIDTTEKIKI